MRRPMVLPLPGNSTKEQSFYEHNGQPVMPGVEWPGPTDGSSVTELPINTTTHPDPNPFKLDGGR